MSNSFLYPNTIHFDQSYINYRFDWSNFSVPLAIIPWIYIIPSFSVIWKIWKIYWTTNQNKTADVNRHVFLAISLSQFACFANFFFDYFMTRLPATGIFTSYCASIQPNHWLKMIIFLALYTNYLSLAFPILLPLIRLVIVIFSKTHQKCRNHWVVISVVFETVNVLDF
ncbi:Protein CBG24170 [Caenorhabditis briggsae]|uniref:Protein CBG24170 n=1 Tax=Caenorhabditis briggsae TaxID=6238 RepID=A8WK46_CAEBR|nr:Protein CBG24170 [Caenorhabditis briggsae]CAP20839.2 Protein CBG24170 [Caenorhabditis briggsae]